MTYHLPIRRGRQFSLITFNFLLFTFYFLLPCLSGCAPLGALASKATPAPKIPAEYVPVQEAMIVLVEGYENPGIVGFLGGHMERMIAEQLITHNVAPIINPNLVNDFRTGKSGDEYRTIKIAAIGQALKAKQVLYVNVTQFAVDSAGGSMMTKGKSEVRVRVVDTATGETRWPRDSSTGQVLQLNTPYMELSGGTTEAVLREKMARALSERVARLFYDFTTDQVDGSEPETGNMAN
ncbi:MAG: hypothetical protein JWN51_1949 [Phycisphaerales bacterium]|nr:hypothetical protein [Phycisphaerales bacterium]